MICADVCTEPPSRQSAQFGNVSQMEMCISRREESDRRSTGKAGRLLSKCANKCDDLVPFNYFFFFSLLKLEKSTQLHSVDIGNEGSAFVEVLVGRSTAPDSYEVILGMSTFMTPQDSKQWNNANRVRIFGEEWT